MMVGQGEHVGLVQGIVEMLQRFVVTAGSSAAPAELQRVAAAAATAPLSPLLHDPNTPGTSTGTDVLAQRGR